MAEDATIISDRECLRAMDRFYVEFFNENGDSQIGPDFAFQAGWNAAMDLAAAAIRTMDKLNSSH